MRAESEAIYCVCKSTKSDDAWIACDNPEGCKIEWFHYECVGITQTTVPTGNWYCSTCREEMKKSTPKAVAMTFVCEYCYKEFSDKRELIEHKKEHTTDSSVRTKHKGSSSSKHRKSNSSRKRRQNNDNGSAASTSGHGAVAGTESSPRIDGECWGMPQLYRHDNTNTVGNKDKTPQPLSPKTGDVPAMSELHVNQGEAEMGDVGPQADDQPHISEEILQELLQYSDEQILAELAAREEAYICVCGTVFRDKTLYYLHRSTHNTNNPKKCSSCDYTARDWLDFMSHFFVHRKGASDAP